jgi:hypothetical protein
MDRMRNGKPWPLEPMDNIDISADFSCPAIDRCCQAWYKAFKNAQAKGTNPVSVRLRANEAYRYAMPPLTSDENVRDFVACVVHGMMVGAIIDELAARWLYAAQIARSMFKQAKRPKSLEKKASGSRSGKRNVAPTPSPTDCPAVPADLTRVSAMACDEEQATDRRTTSESITCEVPGADAPPDPASAAFSRPRGRKPLDLAVLHGVAEVNRQTNRQPRKHNGPRNPGHRAADHRRTHPRVRRVLRQGYSVENRHLKETASRRRPLPSLNLELNRPRPPFPPAIVGPGYACGCSRSR